MFWWLLVSAAALGAAYYRWSRRRLHRLASEVPSGLRAYPIIGHAYKFLGNSEDHMKTIQEVGNIANRQGGLSSFWFSIRLFICITDPSAIEVVSKACLEKDNYTMKILRKVTGNGSIFAPVNIWHPRRKMITPFFNLKNLNRLVPLFHEKSCLMTETMRCEVARGDFEIRKYMTAFAFDSVCESAMGTKINSLQNSDHILEIVNDIFHMISKRMLQPWLHLDCIYERLPGYKLFADHRQQFNSFIDEMIQKKRQELAGGEQQGKANNNRRHKTFLDTVIHTSEEEMDYSDTELLEEVLVMFIAGYESSAITLTSVAVLLSRHPDVQEKLYQELQEVFGDSGRAVTSDDILRLKYLDAIMKETLRLYPAIPIVVREIDGDVLLPSGTTLVAGSSVVMNIWATHRNPSYWGADAELFRPERFLEGPLRHPAQFIPFSYSVRNCIGFMYASLSMKTALANLVRRYRLLPLAGMAAADRAKPLRVQFAVTMTAVDRDNIVRVEERNQIK